MEPLPSWMTWNATSRTLTAQPSIQNVGAYSIRVSAVPDSPLLSDLIGYDTFQIFVEEPCNDGFRFFKVSSYTAGALGIMQCAAKYPGFISFWRYDGSDPSAPATDLIPIPGSYWTEADNNPAPALIFGDQGACMYAKAVTFTNLRSEECGFLYDMTIEGTNSAARNQFRMLARVQDSGPLYFADTAKLGNKLEFMAPELMVPELPERELPSNDTNTLLCPPGHYSHFRLLPATRLVTRDLPSYDIMVSETSAYSVPKLIV